MDFLKKYGVVLGILALLVIIGISGTNSVVTMDQNVQGKWAQVENDYQRRADLIPNLVATVKGYASHESKTLEAVTQARANATKVTIDVNNLGDVEAMKKFEAAQGALSSALSRLLAVQENYPNLKADQNFLALQSQLEGTENRITVARKDYIDAVQEFNTRVRTFPGVLWARIVGAQPKATFTATTEGADKAPAVNFDGK
jgi:LemA protein